MPLLTLQRHLMQRWRIPLQRVARIELAKCGFFRDDVTVPRIPKLRLQAFLQRSQKRRIFLRFTNRHPQTIRQ